MEVETWIPPETVKWQASLVLPADKESSADSPH